MRSWAIPGLGDGDTLGGDAGSELDVFGPVDGEDVGAAGIFAVGADAIDSAAAGAEGLHEAGVIQGWPVVTVEETMNRKFFADRMSMGHTQRALSIGSCCPRGMSDPEWYDYQMPIFLTLHRFLPFSCLFNWL